MRLLLVVGEPVIARHPGVVLVDLAEALLPVVELAGADADPGEEAADGDLGLVAPGADEIDDLVAGVVGDPAAGQSSPSSFFSSDVLFHEFGHDLVLACELGFELLDLAVLGILDGLGLAAVLEGSVAVLEELLLPAVEQVGVDAEFIAEVGDGDLVEQVPFEDGDLLGAGKVTTRACS